MFDAMDAAIEGLAKTVANIEMKDGVPVVSLKEKLECMAMIERWLVRRQKLQPDKDEGEGVALLKQMMADPREAVDRLHQDPHFIEALEAKGWLRPPEKLKGRPTIEQQQHRAEYAAARSERYGDAPPAAHEDSSGWGAFGINPGDPPQ